MSLPVSRLRRWFAVGAILMIATVVGMYFYAQWRVRKVAHQIPPKIGLDIQQTAEGFSVSKSLEGRTLFTVSASKAVQFKGGGKVALHDVKIVIYGKDAGRFDRVTGEDFEYDPASGDVSARGKVLIDLEANPEGMTHSDQAAPEHTRDPIHLETNGLVFNKNTGDASASGKVLFETPQASGSAVGIAYVAKTGTLNLLSGVVLAVRRPEALRLNAEHGQISKQPRQVSLTGVRLIRERQQLRADRANFLLREDNTVDRILADGNVESEVHGARARSDHAELLLTGTRNQLTSAILSGNVKLASEGEQTDDAAAGQVTLHFSGQQVLQTVHAEGGVRLSQKKSQSGSLVATSALAANMDPQAIEITAPAMDFVVKGGRLLERADTSGPPQVVITQPATNQKTVVTAAKFTAEFTGKNRLATLHGGPDAKIVSAKITAVSGQSDRISTSRTLDVVFRPEGGVASITQSGGLVYVDGPQRAWAQRGEYTVADQMLVLGGEPRVVDSGMTTTAQTIRVNRTTGDAIAEGNVKTTYSELKAQPDGGIFASSDPIHVTSHSMTAHRSPPVAVYTGDARLWQNANVVHAPKFQFDRDRRSLVAEGLAQGGAAQLVSTSLVQKDSRGKVTPVSITSSRLTYTDAERKILLDGGVTAKGADAVLTGRQMTVFLLPRSQSPTGEGRGTPGQVEKIVAEDQIVITQPTRHATGDKLVYTAAEDKFVLTGGPPSIFDAERGKITGNSLTFFRHDDRVLVEGNETSPTVTRTQVAR
jgi:lipopolysaccharide export system protein LptA